MTSVYVIIPAAGRGARFSTSGTNKVFAGIGGRPILRWTAAAFSSHPRVDHIVIVAGPDELEECLHALSGLDKVAAIVPGGATRQESVERGLAAIADPDSIVLVHDAARPMVSSEIIDRCIDGVLAKGNAVAAIPVADTLKRVDAGTILETVDRSALWAVQTPQAFRTADLRSACESAHTAGFSGTDESSLIERFGSVPVHIVAGAPENFKITRAEDLALAEAVFASRRKAEDMRVGFGYDIHRFAAGRKMVLGGVLFEMEDGIGLDGHSDADVLLHAVCDALLGAAGLPDIGHMFPNTDLRYKDIESTVLLENVRKRLDEEGYRVSNLDATVIAERPKIAPFVQEIRSIIADILHTGIDRIGIKATTNEGLGAIGEGQGIAAHAVACIVRL